MIISRTVQFLLFVLLWVSWAEEIKQEAEHLDCIRHRDLLFDRAQIAKAREAYRDFQQILPFFIQKEHAKYPASPSKEQEYPNRWERFNLLGPVGPVCKWPLEIYGGGDDEKRACGLKLLQDYDLNSNTSAISSFRGKNAGRSQNVNNGKEESNSCVVFSIGSNNQWGFEDGIVKTTHCTIRTFDCTIIGKVPPHIASRTTFHNICLGYKNEVVNDRQFMTWESLLDHVGMKTNPTFLKVDIEGYEMNAMHAIIDSGKHFPLQIAMEIHLVSFENKYSRYRSSAEMVTFMNYLHTFGGYFMIDRHDNAQCPHCSEILLSLVDCRVRRPFSLGNSELRNQPPSPLKDVLSAYF